MVTVGFAPDLNRILVKVGGSNFDALVRACRDTRCHFHRSIETDAGTWSDAWSLAVGQFPDLVRRIRLVEPFEYDLESMGVDDPVPAEPETEYVRRRLRDDCFRAPPIGGYQREDVRRLISQNRMYLAYDMGLGKTYTIITACNHLFAYGEVDKMLVVVPPEGLYNFRSELLRFSTFAADESIYVADAKNRDPFQPRVTVAIMTYNTFRLIVEDRYFETHDKKMKRGKDGRERKRRPVLRRPVLDLASWGRVVLVCDEAHALGSVESSQTKYVLLHREGIPYRYLLSGTPAPNRPSQWYPQVKLLDASLVDKNYMHWLEDVAVLGTRWDDRAPRYFRPERVKAFLEKIEPWVIRRFGEVDLPDLIFEPVRLRLSDKHEELYRALVEHALIVVKEENGGRLVPRRVEEKFPFITQMLEDPCLMRGKIDREFSPALFNLIKRWRFEDNSKIEILDSLLEGYIETQEKRVILWGGHPASLDRLAERYARYEPIVVHGRRVADGSYDRAHRSARWVEGRTETKDKFDAVERFKADPRHKLLVASYLVLSSAVNITQASRQIFWDRSWDFKYWEQSPKRSHRIGQQDSVIVNPMVIERTLSEVQHLVLDGRRDLNRYMFDIESLGVERWREIFLGRIPGYMLEAGG